MCTYPLEFMAAVTPRLDQEPLVALYDALAEQAGVCRPVAVADPRVACDVLVRDDGVRFAVLVSHAAEPLTVRPVIDGGTTAGEEVPLDPFGVAVLEIAAPDRLHRTVMSVSQTHALTLDRSSDSISPQQ